MSRWFRVYGDLVDDPKFIRLGPDLRSALLMFWCVASKNNGKLPPIEDVAIKFRLSIARTQKLLDELEACGFIDRDEAELSPHNWNGRQFKSDVSNERVQRYRNGKRNVTVTPPESESESESESDTEKKDISSLRSDGWPRDYKEQFWKAYPRKVGKGAAFRKLEAIRKSGETPFPRLLAAIGKIEASEEKFIPHPTTWLNQGRYLDSAGETGPPQVYRPTEGLPSDQELRERYAGRKKTEGIAAESSEILAGGVSVCGESQNGVGLDKTGNGAMRGLGEIFPSPRLGALCDSADQAGHDQGYDDADGMA